MATDNAIVRLLYAILSQKCLKDVDWNKVAHHPVLQQEISNGHAARMRYSRFKKQMDGTSSVRRPRNPNAPRKNKVEKKPAKKVKEKKENDDAEKIKSEEAGAAGSGSGSARDNNTTQGPPEAGPQRLGVECRGSPLVKKEPGSSGGSHYASTPLESTPTPSSSFNGAGEMSDMDEMMASFGMPGGEAMYEPLAAMSQQQYCMGMHMGMGDPFEGLWSHQHQIQAEGDVLVKTEPRWEEAYRQI